MARSTVQHLVFRPRLAHKVVLEVQILRALRALALPLHAGDLMSEQARRLGVGEIMDLVLHAESFVADPLRALLC